MKTREESFFDLTLNKYKDTKGYIIVYFHDEKNYSTVIEFETKEEFEDNFEIKKHPYYPSNVYIPKNIIKQFGDAYECLIDGQEFYIESNEMYLLIDGILQK